MQRFMWTVLLAVAAFAPAKAFCAHTGTSSGDVSAAGQGADPFTDSTPFGQPFVPVRTGRSLRLRFDAATPRADLPSGAARYRRLVLPQKNQRVRISVRVTTEKHAGEPRFTVFSPQLVLLDHDGKIRRIVPLEHMQLDIRPFRPTQLRECIVAGQVDSFLLTTDTSRLGQLYQFNARPASDNHPDHGFYRQRSPMHVFLTWANSGPVDIKVDPAPAEGTSCRVVPD